MLTMAVLYCSIFMEFNGGSDSAHTRLQHESNASTARTSLRVVLGSR